MTRIRKVRIVPKPPLRVSQHQKSPGRRALKMHQIWWILGSWLKRDELWTLLSLLWLIPFATALPTMDLEPGTVERLERWRPCCITQVRWHHWQQCLAKKRSAHGVLGAGSALPKISSLLGLVQSSSHTSRNSRGLTAAGKFLGMHSQPFPLDKVHNLSN